MELTNDQMKVAREFERKVTNLEKKVAQALDELKEAENRLGTALGSSSRGAKLKEEYNSLCAAAYKKLEFD